MSSPHKNMVWALGVAQCTSWGVLFYAFGVLLPSMAASLPLTHSSLSFMATLSALVAAALALPLGQRLDRGGHLKIMTSGSLVGVLACLIWSEAHTALALYAAAVLMGMAQASTLYEPVFAFLMRAFSEEKERHAAMMKVTLIGGLSSTIFLPLITWGMETWDWRGALKIMAGLLLIPAGIYAYWNRTLPYERPKDSAPKFDRRFTLDLQGLSLASRKSLSILLPVFLMNAIVHTSITTHLPSALQSWGFGAYAASWAVGIMGATQLLGRLGLERYLRMLKEQSILVLPLLSMAVSLLLLTFAGAHGISWVILGLLGSSSGLLTLLRPIAVSRLFDIQVFGRINGLLALSYQLARAAGPIGGSWIYEATGRYEPVFWVLAVMLLLAAYGATFLRTTSRGGVS